MRRIAAVAVASALASAILAGGASSHTGHGPTRASVAAFSYSPKEIQLVTGDTVYWVWDGPDTNHTVTADPGQPESFDSDPGVPAGAVSHSEGDTYFDTFHRAGRFTYSCRVHPFMQGTIVVRDPFKPVFSRFTVSPRRFCTAPGCRRGRLRIQISEAATLRGRVQRRTRSGFRNVGRIGPVGLRFGRSAQHIPVAGLGPGSYRVAAVAIDLAGNRSKQVRAPFRIFRSG